MQTLEAFMAAHKKNTEKSMDFSSYVYAMMESHGIEKASEVYTRANVTKQAWSNVLSGKCTPSLGTAVKIALALRLDNHECKYLLKKAGYTLSSASDFALIVRYCIENRIYDLCEVSELLSRYGFDFS